LKYTWCLKNWEEVSLKEFYAFAHLRVEVFVIEQNCPYQELDFKDQKSWHLWAADGQGTVHAYLRIVRAHVSYKEISIGRVVTSKTARKIGLGNELMERAMDFIQRELGQQNVRISAQEYLISFYKKYGFKVVGDVYLEDDIPHLEMLFSTLE
jgi:ElaA protein